MKDKVKIKIQLIVVTSNNTDCMMPIYEASSVRFDTHQTTIPSNIKN